VLIPEKYYERIPQFYFIVGILLLANAAYMGFENFAAYFYLGFGMVSILYAVGVQNARTKHRENLPADDGQQSESESEVRDLS
jgi:hypothetical protein